MSEVPTGSGGIRLGFGCGNLGGEIGRRDSQALLEAAFEAGIRHFDVAPSYGGGMAEAVVGEVLGAVRSQVTLVSKAGIPHPRGAGAVHAIRQVLKPLKRLFPGIWQRAGTRVRRAAAPAGHFHVDGVAATLEESLRRLRTDHLDALLLHEARPGHVSQDLATLLQDLRGQGRIRNLGIASGVEPTRALLGEHPGLFDWVQTDHFWGAFCPDLRSGLHLVTHRVLRTGLELVQQPAFKAHLLHTGGAELLDAMADPQAVPDLLLRAAVAQAGESGIVLFSTSRPERVRKIVEAIRHDPDPGVTLRLNLALTEFRKLAAMDP